MNIEMMPLEIIGLKQDMQIVVHALRDLGCVQIDELSDVPEISARSLSLDRETLRKQEELSFLVARIDGLLYTLNCGPAPKVSPLPQNCLQEAQSKVEQLLPRIQHLTSSQEKLQTELASLPHYEATLRQLLPIIPPSARLPGNVTVGVLVSRVHIDILDTVGKRILDLSSGRAEVIASDVDASTRAMLTVFPEELKNDIEALLGQVDVTRLRLPAELGEGPPDVILANLHNRMAAIPHEIEQINRELSSLAGQWCERLTLWRDALRNELDEHSVLSRFGETDMTFVIVGWVPTQKLAAVQDALQGAVGDALLVQKLPLTEDLKTKAPVVLCNPNIAQPFESLVNLLAIPRYGHFDPTRLMALFLPIFFGMMLGDVGYGLILLTLCLGLSRKYREGILHNLLIILSMGAGWSILFGFLYGELFGTLGERLGMHALWFNRADAQYVSSLLVMTLAIGAIHITLGLFIGLSEAIKDKSRGHMLERGGMLLGLISLFLIVGVLTELLPRDFMTPGISGLILGIVLLSASLGWLGVIMGPIEFISLIGNVLSYLRIAAIGLASVYLAKVANDIAGMMGNIIVGAILAVLIHALNLVLGAFSPTIHSLRLHYVEFFRKFYEGGGRPYEPFKSHL